MCSMKRLMVPNRSALARGIPAFEQDDDSQALLLYVVLQLQQFDVQRHDELQVVIATKPSHFANPVIFDLDQLDLARPQAIASEAFDGDPSGGDSRHEDRSFAGDEGSRGIR